MLNCYLDSHLFEISGILPEYGATSLGEPFPTFRRIVSPCSLKVYVFGHLEPAIKQCHSLRLPEPRAMRISEFKYR